MSFQLAHELHCCHLHAVTKTYPVSYVNSSNHGLTERLSDEHGLQADICRLSPSSTYIECLFLLKARSLEKYNGACRSLVREARISLEQVKGPLAVNPPFTNADTGLVLVHTHAAAQKNESWS